MTKAQATQIWKDEIKPITVFNYGADDKSALRDSWREFISDLEMNGYITERQKSTWTPPKV